MAKYPGLLPKASLLLTLQFFISFVFLLKLCCTSVINPIPNFDLTSVTLSPKKTGFTLSGNLAGDWFGFSVKTAGDINKDGYDDFIIGANLKNSNRGTAYIIYGGPINSFVDIDLSITSLNPATTGFYIAGEAAGDLFGVSVSAAGDINKDGYADMIIGAPGKNAAYVIYGKPSYTTNIELSVTPLDPATTGFKITGVASGDQFGMSVSTAGDINKDGYADMVIGAQINNYDRGAVYVIYGKPSYTSNFNLGTTPLNSATTGFTIIGNVPGDRFGCSVSEAGDVNGDTYDDIVIGAEFKNYYRGYAYVVYGKANPVDIDLSGSTVLDPASTGFLISGENLGDHIGFSVSKAGDVNGDGYGDIIVGGYGVNSAAGGAYVIYGRSNLANIILANGPLDPATTGFKMSGGAAGDHLGSAVSTAGDMNGDGYDEILVGADWWNSKRGKAYVIYGSGTPQNFDFSSGIVLDPQSTGFTITGAAGTQNLGYGVGIAGDINQDGFPDILVGMYMKNSGRGAVNVIHAGILG